MSWTSVLGMSEPTTQFTWVTRDNIVTRHVRGLLQGLEEMNALDYSQIRIIAITEDSAAYMPPAPYTMPDGKVVESGGTAITYDTLPAQGLLLAAQAFRGLATFPGGHD